jgi:hypothetical protein
VLDNPGSFTKQDFNLLQARGELVLATLQADSLQSDMKPTSDGNFCPKNLHVERVPEDLPTTQQGYWNEDEYGSEAGEAGPYSIYINSEQVNDLLSSLGTNVDGGAEDELGYYVGRKAPPPET